MIVYLTYTNGKHQKLYYSYYDAHKILNSIEEGGFVGHIRGNGDGEILLINKAYITHIGIYEDEEEKD